MVDWPSIAIAVIVAVITLYVGATVLNQMSGHEFRQSLCEDQFGEEWQVNNSTLENESIDYFRCEAPNGTQRKPSFNMSGAA